MVRQSHWGNGIKDLLLEESTSPCETSHPLFKVLVCHFQSSKASPKHKTSRSEIQNLIWRCTLLTSWFQEHCQAHIIEIVKRLKLNRLQHVSTIHKRSQKRVGLPNRASRPQSSHWWLNKNPFTCQWITNLFSHPEPPTWRLIGHLSYSTFTWRLIFPPSAAWQSLMAAVHPRSLTRWMGYPQQHQQPWGQPPRPWHQPGEDQLQIGDVLINDFVVVWLWWWWGRWWCWRSW